MSELGPHTLTVDELIEQLELIRRDHPEAGKLEVRCDTEVFAVHLRNEVVTFHGETEIDNYVEIECWRPWAGPDQRP